MGLFTKTYKETESIVCLVVYSSYSYIYKSKKKQDFKTKMKNDPYCHHNVSRTEFQTFTTCCDVEAENIFSRADVRVQSGQNESATK